MEDYNTGLVFSPGEIALPHRSVIQGNKGRIHDLLALSIESSGNNSILFLNEQKNKIAIIRYSLKRVHGEVICYIEFFGTQNGLAEKYSELDALDIPTFPIEGLSYSVMQKFIEDVCIPNDVKRIYLDADLGTIHQHSTLLKKDFWKKKMGSFLTENSIVKRVYSQHGEVCFVLQD